MNTSFDNYALPRVVPVGIKLALFFGQVYAFLGLIFTVIGGIFAFTFLPMADFSSVSFKDSDPKAKGVLTDVHSTNNKENKRYVYAYSFRYTTPDGKTQTDISYSADAPDLHAGDTVTVQYQQGTPVIACISGMRTSPFSPFVAFVLIFPCIGLAFLATGIIKTRKYIRLVTNGMLVEGEVTGKEATGTKINNRRVYKIFFRFTVNGTPYASMVRTHRPERVLDEKKELLLYNPDKPEEAVLVDAMPRAARRFLLK